MIRMNLPDEEARIVRCGVTAVHNKLPKGCVYSPSTQDPSDRTLLLELKEEIDQEGFKAAQEARMGVTKEQVVFETSMATYGGAAERFKERIGRKSHRGPYGG
jgi:hypothetical protein